MKKKDKWAKIEQSLRTSRIVSIEPLQGSRAERAMIDLHATVAALAERRLLFHSEADFQHAFAWDLHLRLPHAAIRLERPIQTHMGLLHVDLVADLANLGGDVLAVELKYKTRALSTVSQQESFALLDQAAQPIGRWAFLQDVARLESLQALMPMATCWAVLLTNDSAYWSEARGTSGISADFDLSDGRVCSGTLKWGANASDGTKGGREKPIELAGEYRFVWRDYSSVDAARYGRFRYLAVEVYGKSAA